MILHAGLIARRRDGRWRGVLIEGASGAGKSDLALRAIEAGWSLVADDRTVVWVSGGRLFGRPAPALAGLIEARGLGVVDAPWRAFAGVDLVVACVPAGAVERAPEFQTAEHLGVAIPKIALTACEASAPAKLSIALSRLGLPMQRAYQACRAGAPRLAAGGDPVRFRE
jgi:serine kinase of HPr protein (carbohydrate metabolism regulator)